MENRIKIIDFVSNYPVKNNQGDTHLHIAIKCNKKSKILQYLDLINEPNNIGETPLHLAIRTRNLEAVKILIENRANINQKCFEEKSSPLFMSAIFDNKNFLDYFFLMEEF